MMQFTFSTLWQQPFFMRFLSARILGIWANQMLMLAVAWHMYELTSSVWDLGMVGLFQFMSALLFTLPAGQIIDRYHRGRIFAFCMAAQVAIAVLMFAGTQGDFATRALIFGVSVVLGITRAFQMPAQQSITPMLVPTHMLPSAIAISSSGVQIAVIGGPAFGGMLYFWGPSLVYVSCAMMFVAACFLTLTVLLPRRSEVNTENSWSSILAGVMFVFERKILLGALGLDLFAVLLGGATALLPVYAKDILMVGPIGLGLLRASPAMGALIISLVLTRWPIKSKVGPKLLFAVALFGMATIVFGLSENFLLSAAALLVTGAADSVSVILRLTLIQLETPDEMRGRVAAVNGLFIGASNQLGEFESGASAAYLGTVSSVVVGGIGTMLIAAAWFKLFPVLARRDSLH